MEIGKPGDDDNRESREIFGNREAGSFSVIGSIGSLPQIGKSGKISNRERWVKIGSLAKPGRSGSSLRTEYIQNSSHLQ